MNNKFSKFTLFAVLCVALLGFNAQPIAAQTADTATTLSSAMTVSQNTVVLASGTGISVQGANNQVNTGIYVDREFMWITSLVSGTTYNVARGKGGTRQFAHISGAPVLAGPLVAGPFFNTPNSSGIPAGACTATAEPYLPRVYIVTGDILDCKSNGQWILVGSGSGGNAGSRVGAFCTGTAGSAETEYLNFAACSGATTLTARQVVTAPGTLANLRVVSSAAFTGGTNKDVITVYKNGSATTITCTAAGAATTCSDTTHSVAVVAGDVLAFQFVSATSDTAANVSANVGIY